MIAPLLLAATTVGLGFSSGGFFAKTQGTAVIVYAGATIAVVVFSPASLGQLRGPLLGSVVAVWALAGWTLLSGSWSGSEARALIEFERVVLYASALLLFGLLARNTRSVLDILAAFAGACFFLCLAALTERLLPDLVAIGLDQRASQLQYPITYANTLGLLAAMGGALSFSFAAGGGLPGKVKIAGAAAVPVFITTLLLTYSRGAIVAGAAALTVFLIAGRSRSAVGALLATAAPAVTAAVVAYHAKLLATADFTSRQAVAEGHRAALALIGCMILAALLRAAGPSVRLAAVRLVESWPTRRPVRPVRPAAGVVAVVVLGGIGIFVAFPALQRGYERFRTPGHLATQDVRARLTQSSGNDRAQVWDVAFADFRSAPVVGHGAGTFLLSWNRLRPVPVQSSETHSLYLQMLDELGLVGLGLLLLTLIPLFVGLARRAGGQDAPLAGALAAAVAWAVAVSVDWQWQMPVATLWLFAVGGAVLATRSKPAPFRSRVGRWVVVIALAAAAVLPARVATAEGELAMGLSAFNAHDCRATTSASEAARSSSGALPGPFLLLGYCALLNGNPPLAVRDAGQAVARDPDNWTYRYGLALVRAAAGLDPRPAARDALRLDPLEPRTRTLVALFRGSDPLQWRRQAAAVPVIIPSPLDY